MQGAQLGQSALMRDIVSTENSRRRVGDQKTWNKPEVFVALSQIDIDTIPTATPVVLRWGSMGEAVGLVQISQCLAKL